MLSRKFSELALDKSVFKGVESCSSLSWGDNGEIFCVFSSTAEWNFGYSYLILKRMPFQVLLGITSLIAIDKIGFQEMVVGGAGKI